MYLRLFSNKFSITSIASSGIADGDKGNEFNYLSFDEVIFSNLVMYLKTKTLEISREHSTKIVNFYRVFFKQ